VSERLDPSRFILSKDRNSSTPAFPVTEQSPQLSPIESVPAELKLPRSPEIENIPKQLTVATTPGLILPYQRNQGLHHSQSATPPAVGSFNQNLGLSVPYASRESTSGSGTTPPTPPLAYEGIITNHHQIGYQPNTWNSHNSGTDSNLGGLSPVMSSVHEERAEDASSMGHGPTCSEDKTQSLTPITFTVASTSFTSDGSLASTSIMVTEDDSRQKPTRQMNRAYYIGKELLMTERTYKKDLDIVNVWFREAVSVNDVMSDSLMELLFGLVSPLCQFHAAFLKHLEARLTKWEGKSNAKDTGPIGDLFLNVVSFLGFYRTYLDNVDSMLVALDAECKDSHAFDRVYREFEAQKICYLPVNAFLLKPAQRLLHYCVILNKLLQFYGSAHPDYADCHKALLGISEVTRACEEKMKRSEMLQKLIELQQDLVGIDTLLQPSREFIREGCLQKLSSKGYQQRMFFLFTDMLVYASRTATRSLQFKVHGCLSVKGMALRDTDPKIAAANSFTVYAGNRLLVVAASSEMEKNKWMEDLQMVLERPENEGDIEKIRYSSLKSNSSSEVSDDSESESVDRQIQHRTNTLMHVCWHRNTSVSMLERSTAVRNLLSGYLLRKFKSGSGWQKLWVVFTNFCLFFYKSHQDEHPLASLPLLGYAVSLPTAEDGIQKDFVFKLQFKNHVYLFRAESQYTFDRWMEVITMATCKSRHLRLFSRMESVVPDTAT
jgi:FERM/RhoGEF/pleckstrin domain protein 2